MTFKIVPEQSESDGESFAQKPVGSGPFRLGEPGRDDRGAYVTFQANPGYGSRTGRAGLPRIREIRFYAVKDPVKELKEGRLHLALDLTAAQAAALASDAKVLVPPPGPNRRVYFLAVNHRPGGVLANPEFRRGLALAIHREELLDFHFRTGLGKSVHKPLNGPFPASSWACNRDKPLDPFDPQLAATLFARSLEGAGGKVELSLKYPAGDPQVAAAMADLRKQVLEVSKEKVTLNLEPLDPHDLRKAVEGERDAKPGEERNRNYQLAYWHYDYPDETYWLGPLLGQGGDNPMNYRGTELQGLIEKMQARREFDTVREQMRALHGLLDGTMPLIPLWQLDPLSAYREELKPVAYDRSLGAAQGSREGAVRPAAGLHRRGALASGAVGRVV